MSQWRTRLKWVGIFTLVFVVLAAPVAQSSYLGSDAFGNGVVGPDVHGLMDKYPLSAYALDYHVDTSILPGESWAANFTQWIAATLWLAVAALMKLVIILFGWAFSLDLLHGPHGALVPVADAIGEIHNRILGETWQKVAIGIAGLWALIKLARRRYEEMVWGLGQTIVLGIIALFFVLQPVQTVGTVSKWTNDLSVAFLSATTKGTINDPEQARQDVENFLFRTMVFDNWVAVEFGGFRHCVDTDVKDENGFPTPVNPDDPKRDVCRNHIEADSSGFGGYAPRFLRLPAGSEARNREYQALKDGKVPACPLVQGQTGSTVGPAAQVGRGAAPSPQANSPNDPASPPSPSCNQAQFVGYLVDKNDSPAADYMQQGGSGQRLLLALLAAYMVVGAIALFGRVSMVIVIVQVAALGFLVFAPAALIAGMIPGKGHDFFKWWLSKLGIALVVKAVYCLVLACLLLVSMATLDATASLGVIAAMFLNGTFYWLIYHNRRAITEWMTGRADHAMQKRMSHRTYVKTQTKAKMAAAMVAAPVGLVFGKAAAKHEEAKQEKDSVPPRPPASMTQPPDAPPPARAPGSSTRNGNVTISR